MNTINKFEQPNTEQADRRCAFSRSFTRMFDRLCAFLAGLYFPVCFLMLAVCMAVG